MELIHTFKEARFEAIFQLGSALIEGLHSMLVSGEPFQVIYALAFIVAVLVTSGYTILRVLMKYSLRNLF